MLAVASSLVSCHKGASFTSTDKIKVVATTSMAADMARAIGGDQVEVISLMGPGVDPHYYKPTAGDVQRLSDADLIVYGGLHLEGRMTQVFERLSDKSFSIGDQVDESFLITKDGEHDPHIWHDPYIWSLAANPLAKRFASIRNDDDDAKFEDNGESTFEQLLNFAFEINQQIQKIPENSRVIVTAHDAFSYYGRRFGIEVVGIQGTNTTAEAGAQTLKSLADMIAKRKIKAIFVESSVPRSTVIALQEAVAARGWKVEIGGELFSDALGDPNTPEGTYAGMLRHNTKTIVEALK
ncbi:MAG: zinc ABC transporter substrate-binding protein [Armatimonadetes bacterium]|nr:zinc ABC transporter substrate-binding protein [Armatimonadota bacterium]